MRNAIKPIALIIQLGSLIVVSTLLPLLIGIWVDGQFHTAPWATLIGLAVGIIVSVAAVYDTISRVYKDLSN